MLSTVHFDIILIQCIPREKNRSPTTEKNHFDQYTNIKLCIKTKLFPIISLIIQACLKTFSFNNVETERRAAEKLVSFIRKLLTSTKISYGNDWWVFFINFHMLESILTKIDNYSTSLGDFWMEKMSNQFPTPLYCGAPQKPSMNSYVFQLP